MESLPMCSIYELYVQKFLTSNFSSSNVFNVSSSEFSSKIPNLFKSDLKKKELSERQLLIVNVNRNEEEAKKRYYGKLKGFVFCQIQTTLYNPKSSLCKDCFMNRECIEILKSEFPEFSKIRKV